MRNFAYDARGETGGNGNHGFTYDFANQPVTVTRNSTAAFSYDGDLKRVKEVRDGPFGTPPAAAPQDETIYSLYSRVTGGLVYRDNATDAKKTD